MDVENLAGLVANHPRSVVLVVMALWRLEADTGRRASTYQGLIALVGPLGGEGKSPAPLSRGAMKQAVLAARRAGLVEDLPRKNGPGEKGGFLLSPRGRLVCGLAG
jgi:hypothetical protein